MKYILLGFLRDHMEVVTEGKTTGDVRTEIIKEKITADSKLSFCKLLRSEGMKEFTNKRPVIFVSHSHSYNFVALIHALMEYLNDNRDVYRNPLDVYVWLDLFAMNQHVKDKDTLFKTLESAIKQIGRVVMIMQPWNDPFPYQRGWCIFEAYNCYKTKSKFEIALTKDGKEQFFSEMLEKAYDNGIFDSISNMFGKIASAKFECLYRTDKEKIEKTILASTTFEKLDSMLFEQYRNWVITAVETRIAQNEALLDDIEHRSSSEIRKKITNCLFILAGLHDALGDYSKAVNCQTRAVKLVQDVFGRDSEVSMEMMSKLALYHRRNGDHNESITVQSEVLEARGVKLGEDHPSTLETIQNLAETYQSMGQYDEASKQLEKCLKKFQNKEKDDHQDLLTVMLSLANVYIQMGKNDEAFPLISNVWEKRKKTLGPVHTHTLYAAHLLSQVCQKKGLTDKALELMTDNWKECIIKFGDDHPLTLGMLYLLAIINYDQHDYSEAFRNFKTCFEKQEVKLGRANDDTLRTMLYLGKTHYFLGDSKQSLSLLTDCAKLCKSKPGKNHELTGEVLAFISSKLHVAQD